MDLAEKKWILVVDDEPEIRSILKELIQVTFGDSVKIIEAQNGVEATSKINCQMFDCIITDLSMPKKEGKAFISSVRQNAFNENTPVIILSGGTGEKELLEKFDFVYFFPKPCDFNAMSEALKSQLKIGSTKNRVSAEALNNVIASTKFFIKSLTRDEKIEQTELEIKKKNEKIDSAVIATIQIKIGKVKNYFSLVVKEKDVESLRKLNPELKDKSSEKISNSLAYVILKNVIAVSQPNHSDRFDISSISHDQNKITTKKGIILTLGNQDLQLSIFASTMNAAA